VPTPTTSAAGLGVTVPDGGLAPVSTDTASGTLPASVIGPLAAEINSERTAVALLGEQVNSLTEAVDAAHATTVSAQQAWETARAAQVKAQLDAADAVTRAYQSADALGAYSPDLNGLGALAPGLNGMLPPPDPDALSRAAQRATIAEQQAFASYHSAQVTELALVDQRDSLAAGLNQRQTALLDLEARNAAATAAAEALRTAQDAARDGWFVAGTNVHGMTASPTAIAALTFALAQRGKPYEWGAEGPNSYDCSGLMWASYRSVGITLPRVARDQQMALVRVSPDEMLPGDLIFFNPTSRTDPSTVSHVGMYYGGNMMIEAPTFGENVKLAHIWWSAFYSAARVVPAVPAPTNAPTSPSPSPSPTPTKTKPSKPPTTPPSTPPSSAPSSSAPPSPDPTPSSSGPSQTPSPTPDASSVSVEPSTDPSATP
jgi:cell wall-associated NlpC family hydrolase